MKRYDIKSLKVEQENLFSEISDYINGKALCSELHTVELTLFRLLLALGLCLIKEVLALRGTGKTDSVIHDSKGRKYRYHGIRSRTYLSIFGLVQIGRAYYRPLESGSGLYPLDSLLNLPSTRYSYLLQQWTHSEIVETTYDKGVGGISDMLGISVWKRGQEDAVFARTVDLDEFYMTKTPVDPSTEGDVLCVTADCKGVRMVPSEKPKQGKIDPKARRSKGDKRCGLRKDAVVTSDFSFHPASRTAQEVASALMKTTTDDVSISKSRKGAKSTNNQLREPLNKQIFAHMDGKAVAFASLMDRIGYRDPESRKPIYVLIDGEPALKKGLLEEIRLRGWKNRVQGICLDIIHVTEYLWEAGTALFGESNPKRNKWVYRTLTAILKGKAGRVIGGLKQRTENLCKRKSDVLHKVIRYFENHRDMMRYDKYLEAGYPIATGVIEGACGSLVKNRTDGSGKRWTKKGVQAVLNLRAIKRNNDWDDYWDYHIKQENKRYNQAA